MKRRLTHSILTLAILFVSLIAYKDSASALSSPYLSLECAQDVVTGSNAVLNAKLTNVGRKQVKAFEITVLSGDAEVAKYQKKVNDNRKEISVKFDLEKDAGITLESGKRYDYIISAITREDVNPSMYKSRHHFTTQSVKVTAAVKKVQTDTATLELKVDNPNQERVKKIGVKVFQGGRLVKDYSKTVNQTEQSQAFSFDIKKDLACPLKQNTKYKYTAYAEIDVSQSYLYRAAAECGGEVTTSQKAGGKDETRTKAGVKTDVSKGKKTITLKNKIHNPQEKKISEIKVVVKSGKKQQVVYRKKVAKKKQNLKSQTVKISLKKTKLNKIAKAKKYTCITYVRIGGKMYQAKVTV